MTEDADTRQFWHEVERCQYEVLPGPGECIRRGVWESPAGACPEDRERACPEACAEPCPERS